MLRPNSDVFTDFAEILSARNRDLKTIHNTFRGCHVHLDAFYSDNLSLNSWMWWSPLKFQKIATFLFKGS